MSSEMQLLTAKVVGNSAFGTTITNKDKHVHVSLMTLKGARLLPSTIADPNMVTVAGGSGRWLGWHMRC